LVQGIEQHAEAFVRILLPVVEERSLRSASNSVSA